MLMKLAPAFLAGLLFLAPMDCAAHFGMIIPSSSTVMSSGEADLSLNIAFAHPFSGQGMDMAAPLDAYAFVNGQKMPLALASEKYLGKNAFKADFKIAKPGTYQFAVIPQPYYEPAEAKFIIHYPKTIVGAFGYEDGWNTPLGLPVEIIPLTRPFANYAGNSFTGMALKNGKPLANAPVEVEFLNSEKHIKAPNAYFETQVVNTDPNGIFTFTVPWAGWWGFAVLSDGDAPLRHDGKEAEVELGGVIWVQFQNAQ